MPYVASEKWYTRVLFAVQTSRVLPQIDAVIVHSRYTDSHWQSTQSLLSFLKFLEGSRWLCLMGAAPVHIAVESSSAPCAQTVRT
eukprot:6482981-Amphidinium_carterae.1